MNEMIQKTIAFNDKLIAFLTAVESTPSQTDFAAFMTALQGAGVSWLGIQPTVIEGIINLEGGKALDVLQKWNKFLTDIEPVTA